MQASTSPRKALEDSAWWNWYNFHLHAHNPWLASYIHTMVYFNVRFTMA